MTQSYRRNCLKKSAFGAVAISFVPVASIHFAYAQSKSKKVNIEPTANAICEKLFSDFELHKRRREKSERCLEF